MLRSTVMSHMSEALADSKLHFIQLRELEADVPWDDIIRLLEPHYLATSIGRHLIPTKTMVRIFFLQLRYHMDATAIEEALFQISALRDFAFIDIDKDIIPNETYIENFNQLISEQSLKDDLVTLFNLKVATID